MIFNSRFPISVSSIVPGLASNATRVEKIHYAFFGAMVAAASLVGPAVACSDLPNICEQHEQIRQQNNEFARQSSEAYVNSVYESMRESEPPPAPRPDPTQSRIGAATAVLGSLKANLDELSRYAKDPRYSWVLKGKWEFYQDTHNAKSGEYCAAIFINAVGTLRLSGPGGDYNGALLTFWGPRIPKPDSVRMIEVSLTQSDDGKTQTVQAFNYSDKDPRYEYGVIALAVPTAGALLDNMKDRLSFKLDVGGETVLDMGWHSGLMARDKLRRCISRRG